MYKVHFFLLSPPSTLWISLKDMRSPPNVNGFLFSRNFIRTHAADVLRNLHVLTMRAALVHLLGSGSMSILMSDAKVDDAKVDEEEKPVADRAVMPLFPDTKPTVDRSSSSSSGQNRSRLSDRSQMSDRTIRPSPSSSASSHMSAQDALALLAMYMSAIIHDYDHRGVTNAFLIQDEDPLAVS